MKGWLFLLIGLVKSSYIFLFKTCPKKNLTTEIKSECFSLFPIPRKWDQMTTFCVFFINMKCIFCFSFESVSVSILTRKVFFSGSFVFVFMWVFLCYGMNWLVSYFSLCYSFSHSNYHKLLTWKSQVSFMWEVLRTGNSSLSRWHAWPTLMGTDGVLIILATLITVFMQGCQI